MKTEKKVKNDVNKEVNRKLNELTCNSEFIFSFSPVSSRFITIQASGGSKVK